MKKIVLVLLCLMQIGISQAQDKKKFKNRPIKEDMTVVVDSLRTKADSLERLLAMKDSLIQSLYKIPDTVVVYGNDSLKIVQQQDSIDILNLSLYVKDSLLMKQSLDLCFADSCMVKYAYGLCYEKFDRANIEEAEQVILRLYQPELKAEMEKELLVLLKNYEVYYTSILGILTVAQNDPKRESSVFIDDYKKQYIQEIKGTAYYKKHYKQFWSIAYLDELIDQLIKDLEAHTRENKVDFSIYLN